LTNRDCNIAGESCNLFQCRGIRGADRFSCGITNTEDKFSLSRIVGGVQTKVNKYPWIALLVADIPSPGLGLAAFEGCTGTLVAAEWVVTTAQCAQIIEEGQQIGLSTILVLGVHHLFADKESNRKKIGIDKIIIHPNYLKPSGGTQADNAPSSNIALLKLSGKVDLNAYTPACLPPAGAYYIHRTGHTYGWGTTTEPLPVLDYSTPPAYLPPPAASSVLREAPLKVVTQQVCQSAVVGAVKIDATMLCAGGNGKGTCAYDAANPLTVPDQKTGQHTLVGLASWTTQTPACGVMGQYDIFTSVSFFRDWIDSQFSANGGATFTLSNYA